jgi:hypothetical protein
LSEHEDGEWVRHEDAYALEQQIKRNCEICGIRENFSQANKDCIEAMDERDRLRARLAAVEAERDAARAELAEVKEKLRSREVVAARLIHDLKMTLGWVEAYLNEEEIVAVTRRRGA